MTLYRTHRPQLFSDLFGQETASQTLQQALSQNRVAHAYLVSGPRGTGKTSTARIFSRALTCQNPKKTAAAGKSQDVFFEPCNSCPACLSILENHTTDLLEIDAASNRGIEDIRELREQTQYPPLQLKKKIYIIDEVHMLTGEAFNALLKTLEEPPGHCLFILATTELHKVPVTIRSRCQLIRFERGSQKAIQDKLDKIIGQEKFKVAEGVTALIAKHAEGGFRDAETLLENLVTQYPSLDLEQARQALGIISSEQAESLLQAALSHNLEETKLILKAAISQLNQGVERLTSQLINRLRDAIFNNESWGQNPAASYALDQLLEAYILQKNSPIPSLPLEIAFLNIAESGLKGVVIDSRSISTISLPIAVPTPVPVIPPIKEHTTTVKVTPEVVPLSSPQVPVIELHQDTIQDPRQAWKSVIEQICRENIILGQTLKDTVFHKAEDSQIIIHVRFKFHADKLNEKKIYAKLKGLLSQITGRDWELCFEVNGLAPKRGSSKVLSAGAEDITAVFGSNPQSS